MYIQPLGTVQSQPQTNTWNLLTSIVFLIYCILFYRTSTFCCCCKFKDGQIPQSMKIDTIPVFPKVNWSWMDSWKEYKLLNQASSLQDIHNLHRGGAQIPNGPVLNNLLLYQTNDLENDWGTPRIMMISLHFVLNFDATSGINNV